MDEEKKRLDEFPVDGCASIVYKKNLISEFLVDDCVSIVIEYIKPICKDCESIKKNS